MLCNCFVAWLQSVVNGRLLFLATNLHLNCPNVIDNFHSHIQEISNQWNKVINVIIIKKEKKMTFITDLRINTKNYYHKNAALTITQVFFPAVVIKVEFLVLFFIA